MATKDRSLADRAISIKGKDYVLVSDRMNYFNDTYPKGRIVTRILSDLEADRVIMQAKVYPDYETSPKRCYVAHSQARWDDSTSFVNKSAALENCETSAVGRALALMGIGVIDSVASVDEINKAKHDDYYQPVKPMLQKIKDALIEKGITNQDEIKTAIHIFNDGRQTMPIDHGRLILAQIDGMTSEELQSYLLDHMQEHKKELT